MIERRQHERFLLEKRAITVLWPASSIVGQIIDISMGGIAFRYNSYDHLLDNSSEIEIIVASHDFRSGVLPFKTVSDLSISDFLGSVSGRQVRRRGVAFQDLNESQKAEVQCFINEYCWRASL